ncbi:MAG: N-acetylmuramoyl-L-alanine amidase [Bacteroidales bacterium]|nr:N-acetylmuramoyl-L-alanine amidase [Bacteroidales bacterium]
MREINNIIVHCTATPFRKHFDVATIRQWHLQRGWDDIGYHYVIYQDGSLHVGRPIEIVGAHAYGHNQGSIGIAYVGGLNWQGRPANTLTHQQECTLVSLIRTLQSIFPQAEVHGHNEYSSKSCPCFNVPQWWQKFEHEK